MGSVSALRGRVVLIVEDEPLVALDIAEEVSAHGAHSLIVSTVQEALGALKRVKCAAAIVDQVFGAEDATEVFRVLEKLQTPFVIYSGYDEIDAWDGMPVIRKPAVRDHLMQAVIDLVR
jgi:DNA-binding response OmpR family regulator